MIEIKEGKVFVNGVPTTDPTYIGCVLLDIAEMTGDTDKCIDVVNEIIQNIAKNDNPSDGGSAFKV